MGGVTGRALGFAITASDSGTSVVDPASIQLKLDGVSVTSTSVTKDGDHRPIHCDPAICVRLEHVASLTGKDMAGNALIGSGTD